MMSVMVRVNQLGSISATFLWTNGVCTYKRHYYNVTTSSFSRLFTLDKNPGYSLEVLKAPIGIAFIVRKAGTK